MRGIVDRLEGDFVVVEVEGKTKDISRYLFDENVKEGDVIKLVDGLWSVDISETLNRKKSIEKLMEDLWSNE